MTFGIGGRTMALLCLWGATTAMTAAPRSATVPVTCAATGAKLLSPAIAPGDICDRFIAALGTAARRPVRAAAQVSEGLKVDLSFRAPGIATANVVRVRAGRAQPPVSYELAVSDRALRASDVERLAGDVARGVFAAKP